MSTDVLVSPAAEFDFQTGLFDDAPGLFDDYPAPQAMTLTAFAPDIMMDVVQSTQVSSTLAISGLMPTVIGTTKAKIYPGWVPDPVVDPMPGFEGIGSPSGSEPPVDFATPVLNVSVEGHAPIAVTMQEWPETLPAFVLRDGYEEKVAYPIVRTSLPGKAYYRRRASYRHKAFRCQVSIDATQRTRLQEFYEGLGMGARKFAWIDPVDQTPLFLKFTQPPAYSATSPVSFNATLEFKKVA